MVVIVVAVMAVIILIVVGYLPILYMFCTIVIVVIVDINVILRIIVMYMIDTIIIMFTTVIIDCIGQHCHQSFLSNKHTTKILFIIPLPNINIIIFPIQQRTTFIPIKQS